MGKKSNINIGKARADFKKNATALEVDANSRAKDFIKAIKAFNEISAQLKDDSIKN